MVSETERQDRMLALNETRYWLRLNRSLHFGTNRMNLTQPDTYRDQQGSYTRGAFILAALDQKLRSATHGEKSVEDVFHRLNQQDQVTHSSFRQTVVAVGGDDLGPWVDRYVSGTAVPPAPETPAEAYVELVVRQREYELLVGVGLFAAFTALVIGRYRQQ
jgi:predicted metalloprotease with PDZ domain